MIDKSHSCKLCGRQFKRNENMKRHIDNKVCQGKQYKCEYCNNTFTKKNNMYRHRKICSMKETNDDILSDNDIDKKELLRQFQEIKMMNVAIQEKLGKIEKENLKLKTVNIGSINNGTVNNGDVYNNNMNITVNIVPFGKEDISKIDQTELLKVFRSGFNSALRLTETTHFNPNYPEFHNVYISSMKNKYAMTYDGTNWEIVMKDELIDQMYDNKRDYIEENLDEFLDSLTNSQIRALQRWMDTDDDHHYVKKVKNNIKLMLYNKRYMAINGKGKMIENIDAKVIKVPKMAIDENVMDEMLITDLDKPVINEIKPFIEVIIKKENAGRPGTKRKVAKAVRSKR